MTVRMLPGTAAILDYSNIIANYQVLLYVLLQQHLLQLFCCGLCLVLDTSIFPTVSRLAHVVMVKDHIPGRHLQVYSYNLTAVYLYINNSNNPPCRTSGLGSLTANRRVWSTQEDEAIRTLVEKHGTSNWTFIADSLALACNTAGRSGKQCWERWHNHLGETHQSVCLLGYDGI